MDGKQFESLFANVCKGALGEDNVKVFLDSKEDREQGTDMTVFGLRVDITLEPLQKYDDAKDNTTVIGEWNSFGSSPVHAEFGFRIGNTHNEFTKFDEPVLVISLEISPYLEKGEPWAIDQLKSEIKVMIDAGSDAYWEHVDQIEDEPQDIAAEEFGFLDEGSVLTQEEADEIVLDITDICEWDTESRIGNTETDFDSSEKDPIDADQDRFEREDTDISGRDETDNSDNIPWE